jgi:hypothetical protein
MATNKTTETKKSVTQFIKSIPDKVKQQDSHRIIDLMQKATGYPPKMWGPSIIGFGNSHYKYESGHEGDMPLVGFSPRSTAIVFYLSGNFKGREQMLEKLGKHKTGKGCVYVKMLEDIDIKVLEKMIAASAKHVQSVYPGSSNS